MPATPDIAAALKAAEELIESLKNYKGEGPIEHLAVLKQADKIRALLETPYDFISQQTETLATAGALHVLQRTGAINKIPATGSITAEELAKAINIDVSAMMRIMRMAVCKGVAVETAPDTYAHNALSEAYKSLGMGSFFNVAMDFVGCWVSLPEYFKTHKSEDLFDPKKSPFAYSRGKEGMTYYEVIAENIEQREVWDIAMKSMEKNMPSSSMFPWGTLEGAVRQEPERPFVVDVGGGRGRALLKIQEEHPGTFGGKLILQDLPIVIRSLKPEDIPNIEPMSYDIFTPQPIKNAHVYFMGHLLHDFYEPVCVQILKNTVSAMGPNSRLIVCDMLVPELVEVNGPTEPYWLDIYMMSMTGKEKTLKEFNQIFDEAGLELVEVYPSGIAETVMLETRLKGA